MAREDPGSQERLRELGLDEEFRQRLNAGLRDRIEDLLNPQATPAPEALGFLRDPQRGTAQRVAREFGQIPQSRVGSLIPGQPGQATPPQPLPEAPRAQEQSLENIKQFLISTGQLQPGATLRPEDVEKFRQDEALRAQARQPFEEFTSEVEKLQLEQPSLAPTQTPLETVGEITGEVASGTGFDTVALFAPQAAALGKTDFRNTKLGKAMGATALSASLVAAPEVRAAAVSTTAGKAAAQSLAKLSPTLKGAIGTLGAGALGAAVLFGKGKVDAYKSIITNYAEYPNTVRGQVEAGMDPFQGLKLLQKAHDEVVEAERQIKDAGNRDIMFRISREYLDIQSDTVDTRANIAENTRAIRNILLTGRPDVDENQLILTTERLP